MKRELIITIITVLLISLVGLALAENQTTVNEPPVPTLYNEGQVDNTSLGEGSTCICPSGYIADENICNPNCYYNQPPCMAPSIKCKGSNSNPQPPIVGASCGTVTPGYQNQCCISKGYSGWNTTSFKCIGEKVQSNEGPRVVGGIMGAYPGERNRTNESKPNLENGSVVCPMDAMICQDGTYVSRRGPNCEFAPCPINITQYNITKEKICCKTYGYGTDMNETNINYRVTDKKDCAIPQGFVGGNMEIVNNSYCIEQIQKDRQEFIDNQWNIMQEKNRIKNNYTNQTECPDNCYCFGAAVKCDFENGTMTIYAGKSGNIIIQVQNINASTNVTLYKADGKVYGVFTGNDTHEIILPDYIRNMTKEGRAINWTGANITLNETGFYNVQAKKKAKLLWIIPVKEKVQLTVNSETGEITKTRTKWWGFLAKDVIDNNNATNTTEAQ